MIDAVITWFALRPRVYLNLITIILTTIGILALSYYSHLTAQQELEEHERFTASIIDDTQITDSIYQLHLTALNFTQTGSASAAEKVDFHYETIRRKLFSSNISISNTEHTIRSLDAYYRGFKQLRILREKRRRYIVEVLPDQILHIELSFERLIEHLNKKNNKLALTGSEALVIFLQATSQANAYLRRYEYQPLQRSKMLLGDAMQLLMDMNQSITDKELSLQIEALSMLLRDYRQNFNTTVEETRGFLYLVNVILAAEANEILYQTDQRKIALNDLIQQHRKEVDDRLNGLVQWAFIISLLALLLQFVISYVITLTITRPITAITDVFNELSLGSGKSNIPKYPQRDEIGDLTNAARTFKQKNIENRKVLNDYKELSEQLDRRISERTKELHSANQALEIAKQKAEDMVQLRSDFIANVSHEIRTPINAVLGMTYLMRHTHLNEQQSEYIESIDLSSKRLLAIINDILDFSKIEAGKLSIETTQLDLYQVVSDSVSMLQAQASAKGIEIYSHFDRHVGRFYYGDPLRLGQVITNLLNNAVKFTNTGSITISIEAVNIQRLRFKIIDTGIGMSDDEIHRLFQAFTQADVSTTRKYGGTGLGLVISKQIIEAMQGSIDVDSKKGHGTTFTFELDLKRTQDDTESDIFKDKRVLLLDADEISRRAFSHLLQHLGAEVVDTQVVDRDHEEELDLILLAVDSREQSTDNAERIAKLATNFPETPICLIYPMSEAAQTIDSERYNSFVQKPLNPARFIRVLTRLMSNSPAHTEAPENLEDIKSELTTRAGSKIIVADDNIFNRQVVAGLLQSAAIVIDEAIDGEDLLAKVQRAAEQHQPYEMVILDFHMPKMNGVEACKKLRQTYPDLPLVMLSGVEDNKTKHQFFEAGASAALSKPIVVRDFYEVVLSYVSAKQSIQNVTETSSEIVIPRLITIDTRSGLRHCGNDKNLYVSLLKSFVERYEHAMPLFENVLASGDTEQLAIEMHSLKGIAASIGAKRLSKSAEKMHLEPDEELLDALCNDLFHVLGELKTLDLTVKSVTATEQFNRDEFNQALLNLEKAVKRRRPKHIAPIVDYIKSVHLPNDMAEQIRQLIELLERFDYQDALNILEGIKRDLQL